MTPRTLVRLAHRGGVAEVRRIGHGAMLSADGHAGTILKGYGPAVEGLRDDVTVSGGLLPPGAVRAAVFDRAGHEHDATCGNGAWIVLLDQPIIGEPPVVRFLDAADDVVAVPLPAGVRQEPVTDAVDPCPACHALDWQRVTSAPENLYGSDGLGRPTAALCGRCGFEENLGVLYAAPVAPSWPADENTEDTDAEIAEREAEGRQARLADARSARFEFYGLATGSPMLGGMGRSNGVPTSITLDYETPHGRVSVQTDTDQWLESPFWLARGALEGIGFDDHWPQLSDTAVLLWINARTRERVAEAHRADVRYAEVALDGEPVEFATASVRGHFAAAARLRDATILVFGQGTGDGLALRTVAPDQLDRLR